MPDDPRDTLRKRPPPTNIREQIASGKVSREDPTPIGAPPEESRARLGDLMAVKHELVSRFEQHASDDIRQLSEIRGELVQVRGNQNAQAESMSELKTETKLQSLDLRALVKKADLDEETKTLLERERAKLDLRDGADARKKQRDFWWRVAKGIALGVIGLAIAIATHYIEKT